LIWLFGQNSISNVTIHTSQNQAFHPDVFLALGGGGGQQQQEGTGEAAQMQLITDKCSIKHIWA